MPWKLTTLFTILGFSIAAWLAGQPLVFPDLEIDLRRYHAPRAAGPISIDGRLDEPAWAAAPVTAPFMRSDGKWRGHLDSVARLVWDDEALYVAFIAADRDLHSPFSERDDALYTRDVVEVFLDPGGDGRDYYELEVSPRGVLFDALFASHRHDLPRSRAWDGAGIEAAAHAIGTIDDDSDGLRDIGWSAELRIPFAAIRHAARSPPQEGDEWRMNLFRIDAHAEGGHYTAWTPPLRGDFHALDRFGTLVFAP